MPHTLTIPTTNGDLSLSLDAGESILIVGANGSGKTRLGVLFENQVRSELVQRISAQKSLSIPVSINVVSLESATSSLHFGSSDSGAAMKDHYRWGRNPATHQLSDFDALLQTLFAEHNRVASTHLQQRKQDPNIPVPTSQLELLRTIWESLLPHRRLELQEAAFRVQSSSDSGSSTYPASEMSDGERVIFYLLGQALLASRNSVTIVDEPESHIHKAILEPLWRAIENARADCSFILITHDVDFAATHTAKAKYFIRSYSQSPLKWDFEELPKDTGIPDRVLTEVVGSRKPILFVEGERGSLDLTAYEAAYSHFTLEPIGSCEAVIHSVASFRGNPALHWIVARGLVDADGREPREIEALNALYVYTLSVAEVENIFLLPSVFRAISNALLCPDPDVLVERLTDLVMRRAADNLDLVSARYTSRQLDSRLKRVTVAARDLISLQRLYAAELGSIDPTAIFNTFKTRLEARITARDLRGVLALYDNKGLLSEASSILGLRNMSALLEKVGRMLDTLEGEGLRNELRAVLPAIPA